MMRTTCFDRTQVLALSVGCVLMLGCSRQTAPPSPGSGQADREQDAQQRKAPTLRGTWVRTDPGASRFDLEFLTDSSDRIDELFIWGWAGTGDPPPVRLLPDVDLSVPTTLVVPFRADEDVHALIALRLAGRESWWVESIDIDPSRRSEMSFQVEFLAVAQEIKLPADEGSEAQPRALEFEPPDATTGARSFLNSIEEQIWAMQPHIGGKVGFVADNGSYLAQAGSGVCRLGFRNWHTNQGPITHVWMWIVTSEWEAGDPLPTLEDACHSDAPSQRLHSYHHSGHFNCEADNARVHAGDEVWLVIVVELTDDDGVQTYWPYVSDKLENPQNLGYRCICNGAKQRGCPIPCGLPVWCLQPAGGPVSAPTGSPCAPR